VAHIPDLAEGADVDRSLTLRLLLLLPAIALGLKIFGFRRLYLFLLHHSRLPLSKTEAVQDAASQAERLAAAVVCVNRRILPYESRCLLESLVLLWVLRRAGIPAELFLGVRTIMGPFEAHAWVEYDGRVLNDDDGVRGVYETFDLRSLHACATRDDPQAQMI